jgi:hypothetical protein
VQFIGGHVPRRRRGLQNHVGRFDSDPTCQFERMTDRITLVRIQYFPLMGNTPLGASDSLCIAQLDFEFGPGGLKSLAANDLIGLHH